MKVVYETLPSLLNSPSLGFTSSPQTLNRSAIYRSRNQTTVIGLLCYIQLQHAFPLFNPCELVMRVQSGFKYSLIRIPPNGFINPTNTLVPPVIPQSIYPISNLCTSLAIHNVCPGSHLDAFISGKWDIINGPALGRYKRRIKCLLCYLRWMVQDALHLRQG